MFLMLLFNSDFKICIMSYFRYTSSRNITWWSAIWWLVFKMENRGREEVNTN